MLQPIRGAKARGEVAIPNRAKKREPLDRGVLITTILLILMGIAVLFAASYYNAQDKGNPLSEVNSQLLGIALGTGLMLVLSRLDYHLLSRRWVILALLGASFVLLILVAIPGIGKMINGSRRWLRLGPISFQPSEIAKYATVLYMAKALSSPGREVRRFFSGMVPLLIIPGVFFFLILLQPNLSTAGSILIVSAVMIMMAGAKWLHLVLLGSSGLGLGAFYALSEEYRRARMLSFRDPFAYMSDEGYQLSQSLLAFGSGGLFGMGLGRGRQKYAFMPYPESDFIFAVVGEDLGFVGCVLVLLLFFLFLFFGLRVALRAQDRFGSLLAAGITAMIGVQTVLNVAVVIGIMPTTGLPLPFFSSGGTSISILMGAVGVLLSVSRRRSPAQEGG